MLLPAQGSLGISNGWNHNNVLTKQEKEGLDFSHVSTYRNVRVINSHTMHNRDGFKGLSLTVLPHIAFHSDCWGESGYTAPGIIKAD